MAADLIAVACLIVAISGAIGGGYVLDKKFPGGPAAMVAKLRAKRIGAQDVPFILEAYREIDAMGLNGPRMAPEMPHGDQRNGYLTPEQRLILADHHPFEAAPSLPSSATAHGRLGRVANERYDILARAAYMRAKANGAPSGELQRLASDIGDIEVRYAYRNGAFKTISLPLEVVEDPSAFDEALRDAKFKLDCEDIGVVPGPLS